MGIRNLVNIAIASLLFFPLETAGQENIGSGPGNFQEVVWLTTGRQLYLSGETIDFRAVVLEKDTYQRSILSRNIRIELLDTKGLPVKQLNLSLTGSAVEGCIPIPAESNGGWYYLRAYTNWMRNFDDSGFALLPLKIFNPLEKDPAYLLHRKGKIKIRLFPGAENIGLFAGYGNADGLITNGSLINHAGDTIASFSTGKSGWALIPLEVNEEENYLASLNDHGNDEYIREVEIARSEDYKISIKEIGGKLEINTIEEIPARLFPLRILIHQSYNLYFSIQADNQDIFPVTIPKNLLPGGMFQVSIVGKDDNVIAKRLWSFQNQPVTGININSENNNYGIREDISLSFDYNGDEADLEIQAGLKEPLSNDEIFIPGLPGWNCSSEIPADNNEFKAWLLANSYEDEIVYRIIDPVTDEQALSSISYLPETRAGVLSGKVVNGNTGIGIANTGVSISVLNNNYFDACKTDAQGKYYFSLPELEGSTDYILNFTSITDSVNKILVTPEFEQGLNNLKGYFSLDREELDYLQTLNNNLKLSSIYGVMPAYREPDPQESRERQAFFHPPDHVTVVDDFIKLANIREVIYEVVPNVWVRSSGEKSYLRVITENPFPVDLETLVLLDGIPLADQTELLELPPDRIEKIEVKNRLYIYGRMMFSAIVNFVSPNKDYAGLELPENSILSTILLPSSKPPLAEKALTDKLNTPILDRELYREAGTFRGSGKVNFTSNDATGSFRLVISGFDEKGNWLYGSRDFSVDNK